MKFSLCLLIVCCLSAELGAAAMRVGLLGPSRENAHWQFFKRGLTEAVEREQRSIEWIDLTAWKATGAAQEEAAARLVEEAPDAVILWPLSVEALAGARRAWSVAGVPVYTLIRPLPDRESAGHLSLNETAFSAVVHVVAVDLSPRRSGDLFYIERSAGDREPAFEQTWFSVFQKTPAWPATGAWSWVTEENEDRQRYRLRTVVTPELRLLEQTGGFPGEARSLPRVALAMDSYALSALGSGRIDALVVPHMAEGARWLVQRLGGDPFMGDRADADTVLTPLIITEMNRAHWREWWLRWER